MRHAQKMKEQNSSERDHYDAPSHNLDLSHLTIPSTEYSIKGKRDSGPGGQNRNKVNSAAELRFPLRDSETLSDAQKEKIIHELTGSKKINNKTHEVVLNSADSRDFKHNARNVVEKLQALLRECLKEKAPRKESQKSRKTKNAEVRDNIKDKLRKKERRQNKVALN